jgi:hypothetical protein
MEELAKPIADYCPSNEYDHKQLWFCRERCIIGLKKIDDPNRHQPPIVTRRDNFSFATVISILNHNSRYRQISLFHASLCDPS